MGWTSGRHANVRHVCAVSRREITDCLLLAEGTTSKQGASAFINPLTALGMVETLRREGHSALVHTAAASSLGHMLNRLCQADGIPLINIVRNAQQVATLHGIGAKYVLDSTNQEFAAQLTDASPKPTQLWRSTAVGGGTLVATILTCMERGRLPPGDEL